MFHTGKPLQLCYRAVLIIGPICKLQRKWSVVNMAPGCVFTTFNFLHNLEMGPMFVPESLYRQLYCKNTSLLEQCVSYEENKVLQIRPHGAYSHYFIFFLI